MKRFLPICFLACIACIVSGCQNDGHIGRLFGVWRVQKFTIDGIEAENTLYKSTTFGFQNNIVEVVALDEHPGDALIQWGTWSEEGDNFILNFTHSDSSTPPATGIYAAPWWLGMSSTAPMSMRVSHKGDTFTLTWTTDDGTINIYELAKTW